MEQGSADPDRLEKETRITHDHVTLLTFWGTSLLGFAALAGGGDADVP